MVARPATIAQPGTACACGTTVKPEAPQLTRPPFGVVAGLDPARVGAEMVACFARIGARADRLVQAHALTFHSLGLPATDPLRVAGQAMARDIDRGIGAGVAAGYHNGQHFLEVMLSALYLGRMAGLEVARIARVASAALMHDFHHDGSRTTASSFRLELLAVRQSLTYLRDARVDTLECERLGALVLATEPRAGVPFARACWKGHSVPGATMPALGNLPAALARLPVEPELAFEAVLLAEADVLPSIGYTFGHAERLQARLAAEWGARLGRDDKLQFIERMVGDISIAVFFVPNMHSLRQAYLKAG